MIYGLDIETDTRVNGLDPTVARVVTVALSWPGHDRAFTGPEPELLEAVDEQLLELPPGVIATWNGGAFDLPFLAYRARRHGVGLGLRIHHDPALVVRGAPLPGHPGAYRGEWYEHRHLDTYRVYKSDVGPLLRISCSLKSIARAMGLTPVEVDRSHIHDLTNEALHAYAASDARLARVLTERRWSSASRHVDRMPSGEPAHATARALATPVPRVRITTGAAGGPQVAI